MIDIRPRRAEDLAGCVAALEQVHRADEYPSRWPADPVRWLTPDNVTDAWVTVIDGTIAGHVLLRRDREATSAYVSRLFVIPSARGQELGTALLHQVMHAASQQGWPLALEVDGSSGPAIRVYERAGWHRTHTTTATWTHPDGRPVTLLHYATTAS